MHVWPIKNERTEQLTQITGLITQWNQCSPSLCDHALPNMDPTNLITQYNFYGITSCGQLAIIERWPEVTDIGLVGSKNITALTVLGLMGRIINLCHYSIGVNRARPCIQWWQVLSQKHATTSVSLHYETARARLQINPTYCLDQWNGW